MPERAGSFAFSDRYEAQSSEAKVGGDIYDLFPLGEQRWGVVIADVSGKGLAAARKTAMVKYALRSYAREHMAPAAVLTRLNDALFDEPDLTGFVTLVYGVLSGDGAFTYASAGHETPLLRRAGGGGIEPLMPTGMVLGAVRDLEYAEQTVVLRPGDGLLLYTDGLSEARSPAGEFLDVEGLAGMLAAYQDCPRRRGRRARGGGARVCGRHAFRRHGGALDRAPRGRGRRPARPVSAPPRANQAALAGSAAAPLAAYLKTPAWARGRPR